MVRHGQVGFSGPYMKTSPLVASFLPSNSLLASLSINRTGLSGIILIPILYAGVDIAKEARRQSHTLMLQMKGADV